MTPARFHRYFAFDDDNNYFYGDDDDDDDDDAVGFASSRMHQTPQPARPSLAMNSDKKVQKRVNKGKSQVMGLGFAGWDCSPRACVTRLRRAYQYPLSRLSSALVCLMGS